MTKAVTSRTTLAGTFAFQRPPPNRVSLFDFADTSRQSSLNGAFNWTRRFNTRLSVRARLSVHRDGDDRDAVLRESHNVSGDAGIVGNNQDAANWGPPTLSFPDIAGLRDVEYQRSRGLTHAGGAEAMLKRGRHNLTMGGDVRRNGLDVLVAAESARHALVHRRGDRQRLRGLSARPADDERDRVRRRRCAPSRRCLRRVLTDDCVARLTVNSASLGIRSAVHRSVGHSAI